MESKINVSTFSDSIRQSSLVVPEIFFFVKQTFQSNSKFVVRKIRASLYEQGSDWNYQGIKIQVIEETNNLKKHESKICFILMRKPAHYQV